jgi:hypothetical protein
MVKNTFGNLNTLYLVTNQLIKISAMRSFLTILSLLFSFFLGLSQDNNESQTSNSDVPSNDNTEIKLNVLNFILFNSIDGTAEFLLNEESSLGVSVFVNLGESDDIDILRNWSITPYYRQFFSKRYAQGFFVEGFGMLVNREDLFFDGFEDREDSQTTAALGISVGGKFLTRGGFIAEIYVGVGRALSSNDSFESFVSRGGISLGYRF